MSRSFADLGVPSPLLDVLGSAGITTPTPIQSATLPDALTGRDVLGRSRTGEEDWIVRRRRTQLIAWLSRQHPNALPHQRVEVSGERRPALA